ncbi:hypothetical protein EU545_04865 [Candidatus Thorarchaeota archaeon]|nr:MAG: hypothetical protein EU545_04865 [Candidatus Thorarchaeota archaeon]
MREPEALAHAEYLTRRVGEQFTRFVVEPIKTDYMLLAEGTEASLGDQAKSLIPFVSAKREVTTDLIVWCSYRGRLDYLPVMHVMLSGAITDNVFAPTRIEYGTVLDVGCPNHLVVKKSGMTPRDSPLGYLLRIDERFNRFLQGISETYEIERSTGIGKEKMTLKYPPTAEVLSQGDKTFAGLRVLPTLKGGLLKTVKDKTTGAKGKTWGYEFEPVDFELFARLAYYTNYLAYPGKTAPTEPKEMSVVLPLALKSREGGGA